MKFLKFYSRLASCTDPNRKIQSKTTNTGNSLSADNGVRWLQCELVGPLIIPFSWSFCSWQINWTTSTFSLIISTFFIQIGFWNQKLYKTKGIARKYWNQIGVFVFSRSSTEIRLLYIVLKSFIGLCLCNFVGWDQKSLIVIYKCTKSAWLPQSLLLLLLLLFSTLLTAALHVMPHPQLYHARRPTTRFYLTFKNGIEKKHIKIGVKFSIRLFECISCISME